MVIHPLALSEVPNHLCGHSVMQRSHLVPEKQRSGASGVSGVELFPESLSSQMDVVVPKAAKTQKRRVRYCLIICP